MYLVLSEKLSSNLRYRIYLIDYFSYFKMLKTMNCFQRNLLNRSKITLKFIFCEKIEVWKYGSIKSSFLLDPKTSCGVMDPENHQGSITPHEVLGPPKHMMFSCVVGPSNHMRFWEGKTLKILIRVHQTTWGFGSIKTHEVLKGEKLDLGPSNHMSFLGPSKHMGFLGPPKHIRFQKGKHKNGSHQTEEEKKEKLVNTVRRATDGGAGQCPS